MTVRHALPLILLSGALLVGCRQPAEDPRLVLIGIDGGSWNLVQPMLDAGELPRLAALAQRGVTGDLEVAVEPLISPAIWTSIATGRSPEAHGITTFTADRRAIRVPTIWERLSGAGLRVGLYDYLITWPPRQLAGGFVVPGWLRRDGRIQPPDLFERAGIPPYSYEVVDIGTLDDVVGNCERELARKPGTWNRLAEAMQPQVGAVVFFAVDVMSHRFIHTVLPADPAPSAATDPRFDDVIPKTLRGVDRAVGEIVDALEPEDRVVVVSDHGFRAISRIGRIWGFDRRWLLEKAGVETDRDGVAVINSFMHLDLEATPGPAAEREAVLGRLEAFFAGIRGPGGEPMFRVDTVREPEQAAESGHPQWILEVVHDRMPAYGFVFVRPNAEVFDRLWPDGEVEVAGERHPLRAFTSPHVFTGDHDTTGIFFAAGGAIRPQAEKIRLSVLDIAPLLFYLAGQPIPDDLEGTLHRTLIEPRYLERHPPRRVPAAEVPGLPEEPDSQLPESASNAEIERRLKALGYLQ